MLRHIVMLKFNAQIPEGHIEAFHSKMIALTETLPEIQSLEFGIDTVSGSYSWHVVMTMDFETVEELRAYQIHPDHRAIAEFNKPYLVDIASVDYHLPE